MCRTDSRLLSSLCIFSGFTPAVLASWLRDVFVSSFWCESKFTALERSEDLPDIRAGVWYRQDTEVQEIAGKYFREVCVDYILPVPIWTPNGRLSRIYHYYPVTGILTVV
jgi:hypothetical protein